MKVDYFSIALWLIVLVAVIEFYYLSRMIYDVFLKSSSKKEVTPAIKSDSGLIQATECGHEARAVDWVEKFGEKIKTKVPIKDGKTSFCHKCLEEMAIRCAWCGRPIFIGDPITLYFSADNCKESMPDYAVIYDDKLNIYVGCLRRKCAETGADRAGVWIPPGKVERIPSPIEASLHDLRQGGDGIIVINDMTKVIK